MSPFERTVSSLIPDWPRLEHNVRAAVAVRCATQVRRQVAIAPAHVRIGFWALFLAFRVFILVKRSATGKTLSDDSALETFATTRFPMAFGLERILRSATLLFYFEQPEVLAALGEDTIANRQATFRAKRAREVLRVVQQSSQREVSEETPS